MVSVSMLVRYFRRLRSSVACQDGLSQSNFFARAILWILLSSSGLALGWLCIAQTDEVVTATGKLEPIGQVKTLQIPIGGVLVETLVQDGQRVSKGQILLRLDGEASAERLASLNDVLATTRTKFDLKRTEKERYLLLNDIQISTARSSLDLESDVMARFQGLERSGAISDIQYLQQKNKVRELSGEIQRLSADRQRQSAIYDQDLQGISAEIAELRAEISTLSVNIRYQDLRSPVDGIVFDLKPRGIGFVAQSSEPVMKIVPFSALEAKVEIPSSDIGFVSVGKPVDISVDSFPASDFGVLRGTLSTIGSDALPPDQLHNYYRFPASITLDSQQLQLKSGKTLPLQVGMSLVANIKLRKVSYIQLILGSFRDKASALREI